MDRGECPGTGAYILHGKCPNDPENIKCCTGTYPICRWIQNGRCEGPENVR